MSAGLLNAARDLARHRSLLLDRSRDTRRDFRNSIDRNGYLFESDKRLCSYGLHAANLVGNRASGMRSPARSMYAKSARINRRFVTRRGLGIIRSVNEFISGNVG